MLTCNNTGNVRITWYSGAYVQWYSRCKSSKDYIFRVCFRSLRDPVSNANEPYITYSLWSIYCLAISVWLEMSTHIMNVTEMGKVHLRKKSYCHLWPARLHNIFQIISQTAKFSLKTLLHIKYAFWFYLPLSPTFPILRKIGRDMIERAYRSSCKPVFFNRRAAARYRALVSIIPGRERFSWNMSL